jgi:hypothetical protein
MHETGTPFVADAIAIMTTVRATLIHNADQLTDPPGARRR